MAVDAENGSCRFLSPTIQTRVSICIVAYQGKIIRDRTWTDAKPLYDTCLVPNTSSAAIQLNDAVVPDTLCQVLVGRADIDPADLPKLSQRRGRPSQSIVGF